jgi:transposase
MKESKKKRFPSQDPALKRSRREIKQLEESLRKEAETNQKLQKKINNLEKENDKLKKELAALRQPPEWAKRNKTEEEKKRQKKKGPKFGHKANIRKRPDRVDREVNVVPKECPHCQSDLPNPHKWHNHVQIDLPPPVQPIVTRYHVGWSWCKGCQKEVSSNQKLSGSLYGPALHAQVSYWHFSLGLTFGKIATLLNEQYDLLISRGQLSELVSRSAGDFNHAYEDIQTSLLDQSHLYADETGWRSEGISHWLWSFSNNDLSYYVIDRSRGSGVVEDVLGKSYRGVLSSDFYGAYNKIDCLKQKCWVHLLRDLHNLREKYPRNNAINYYRNRLRRFYDRGVMLQAKKKKGRDVDKRLTRLIADTLRFIYRKHRHPELKRLSKRLIKYKDDLYTFVTTDVDPTNNHAEREIRPAVLMRKISYGNRSNQGTQNQAILMSIIRTAQKKNQNFVKLATQHLARGPTPNPLEFR